MNTRSDPLKRPLHVYLYLKHFLCYAESLGEGTTKAVHGLASGMVAAGAKVTVLCEGETASVLRAAAGYDIECFERASFSRFCLSDGLTARVSEIADGGVPSVFVLNGMFHPSVHRMASLLQKRNLPYVVMPHDPYHPTVFEHHRMSKKLYWSLFEAPMLRNANGIQVLDQRHEQYLKSLEVSTPVFAVGNGFMERDVPPEDSLEWRLNGPVKLVFLGRMDAHNKGLDLLVNALPNVMKQSKDSITLELRGPDCGDREMLITESAKRSLPVLCREPNYKAMPYSILAEHDIFCLTSRFEGFGLAALEAMLAGRVIVVSEIAGIAPHVRAADCGVVVQPSSESISEGILKLIERRNEWPEMGRRGRQYVLDHLNWQELSEQALEQYELLVQSHMKDESQHVSKSVFRSLVRAAR